MSIEQIRPHSLGFVPDIYFDQTAFSNITEMISDREFHALLRLCGINTVGMSDYDHFKSFCKIAPMLRGHSIPNKIASFLKQCFDIETPCTPQTCDSIWKTVSNKLFESPTNGWDCLKKLNQNFCAQLLIKPEQLIKIDEIPPEIDPVLCGNLFINTATRDWKSWEAEMEQATNALWAKGGRCLYFKITDQLAYEIPSVYHVEQALHIHSTEQTALLLTQALRQLCLVCRQKEMTLYLDIESIAKKQVILLLERLYKSVGLPHTVFFTRDLTTLEAMISLSASLPIGLLSGSFVTGNYPSANELKAAYESTVARYPAGLLNVFYGFDLRYSNYEKDRFLAL